MVDGEFEGAGLSLIRIVDEDHFALLGVVRDEFGHGSSLNHGRCVILSECCEIDWVFIQPQRRVNRRAAFARPG